MTGVLPVGLGKTTRIMPLIVHSVKEYMCVMELHREVRFEDLSEVAKEFTGKIYQRPPVRSNVKRRVRIRRIHELEVLELNGRHALLRVKCDAGTYMRKLCHDMGLLLGTGAHMRELRRIRSGPFTELHSFKMQEISEAIYLWKNGNDSSKIKSMIYTAELGTCLAPKIVLKDTAVSAFLHGATIGISGIAAFTKDIVPGKDAAVFTLKGELAGIAKILTRPEMGGEARKKSIAKPSAVIMERSSYPKTWGKKG